MTTAAQHSPTPWRHRVVVVAERPAVASPLAPPGRRRGVPLLAAAALMAAAAPLYAGAVACHPLGAMLTGFDLRVYRGAGLLVWHDEARLYRWQLIPGARFTYTPFA